MCREKFSLEGMSVDSLRWNENSRSFAFVGSIRCPRCAAIQSIEWGKVPLALISGLRCPACDSNELQMSSLESEFNQTAKGAEVIVKAEVKCKRCSSTSKKIGRELHSKLLKIKSVTVGPANVEFHE